jgi:trypsin-like peptidase
LASGSTWRLLSLILVLAGVASAQSAQPEGTVQGVPPGLTATPIKVTPAKATPPRKDIPAIAKAANGAIVTIIMAAGDKPIAQGTGFLVSVDGLTVTNYHVIAEGNVAVVKFPDGTVFHVDGVLAADKLRDVAVIKIHGKAFRTLTLGNSDRVQVGEEVVAIGNPLSLESTVSNGIISGVRTDKEAGGKFLQTTAPISPGSSGGPLFNMRGEVVGINTMYLEGGENLNFAIPVNDAKQLLLNQSTKLYNLPNESPPKESPKASPVPPSVGQNSDSPAYQQYQELLTAGDLTMRAGTYACFFDNKKWNKNFFVITVWLRENHTMQATVEDFKDGVLEDMPRTFEGKIEPFSSKQSVFADLLTTTPEYLNRAEDSHKKDIFKWVSGDITIVEGFGELMPGQLRMGGRFKLQHSTGRFVQDSELSGAGIEPNGLSTTRETGKCIRIPNGSPVPEEQYEWKRQ